MQRVRFRRIPDARRRTPDEFPMDYSRDDAMHLVQNQRYRRLKTSSDVRRACAESENLRQYSRRRFEHAVQNASPDSPYFLDQKLLTSVYRPSVSSTGPTRHGSILYNRTPLLLNSIRMRPKSESSARYDHLRGHTYPDIQRTLCKSNCDFRIRNSPVRINDKFNRTVPNNTNDLLLVPLNSRGSSDAFYDVTEFDSINMDFNEDISGNQTHIAMNGTIPQLKLDTEPEMPKVEQVRQAFEVTAFNVSDTDSYDGTSDNEKQTLAPKLEHCEEDNPESTDVSLRPRSSRGGRSLKQEKKSRSRSPSPAVDLTQTNRLTVKNTRRPSSGTGLSEGARSRSGSVSSTSSIRSVRQTPKCWVDDVTISSDHNMDEVESNAQDMEQEINHVRSEVKNANICLDTGCVDNKNENEDFPLETQVADEHAEETKVINLDDLKNQHLELPAFMCPSSERKSRQAAIKEWLGKTSFKWASRNVPLL